MSGRIRPASKPCADGGVGIFPLTQITRWCRQGWEERQGGKADQRKPTTPHAIPPGKFHDPLLHPALTFSQEQPTEPIPQQHQRARLSQLAAHSPQQAP
jgi:hypothetical protein